MRSPFVRNINRELRQTEREGLAQLHGFDRRAERAGKSRHEFGIGQHRIADEFAQVDGEAAVGFAGDIAFFERQHGGAMLASDVVEIHVMVAVFDQALGQKKRPSRKGRRSA